MKSKFQFFAVEGAKKTLMHTPFAYVFIFNIVSYLSFVFDKFQEDVFIMVSSLLLCILTMRFVVTIHGGKLQTFGGMAKTIILKRLPE